MKELITVGQVTIDPNLIGPVELQEYLFANTSAKAAHDRFHQTRKDDAVEKTILDLRQMLRLHRFSVLTWLIQQGVSIPLQLIADQCHPEVGDQLPDQKIES